MTRHGVHLTKFGKGVFANLVRKALNQVHQERVAIVLREVNAWGAAKKHPGNNMMEKVFSLS